MPGDLFVLTLTARQVTGARFYGSLLANQLGVGFSLRVCAMDLISGK